MKNLTEISKIKRVVKVSKTMVNLFMIICIITIIISSLTIICALFKPTFSLATDKVPLQSLKAIQSFSSSTANPDLTARYMTMVYMVGYILYSIFLIIILRPFSKVLSTVIDENPFEEHNWKYISLIGWKVIISISVITLIQRLLSTIILSMIKVNDPLMGIKVHTDWLLVFLMIFSGLLILIFAQVFKYGTYLQNEYDSTL